jgi:DNA-directed RNA polymerase subunit M/transcription elongation factor TFIIS
MSLQLPSSQTAVPLSERHAVLQELRTSLTPDRAVELEQALLGLPPTATASQYRRNARRLLHGLRAAEPGLVSTLERSPAEALLVAPRAGPVFDSFARRRRDEMAAKELLRQLTLMENQITSEAGVRCAKCRSTDISFEFCQTRSADEGTTVFCLCRSCHKRWKM